MRIIRASNPLHLPLVISSATSRSWYCQSCRRKLSENRAFGLSTSTKEKPYYITTPIFYVNAAPHIGHLSSMVLADTLKRWQTLKGKRAILCTGTDEHGMKIQQAAALAGSEPKQFCDAGAEVFKTLAERSNVQYDHFVRTTDEDHKDAVRYFWRLLQDRGYIYKSNHEGWYSVSDEAFYSESAVQLIQDPRSGRKMMTSIETGKEVERTSESNYHFRLSSLKDRLLELYKQNEDFVYPRIRMDEVVANVTQGLQDLSISRPVERLSWGVRVPGDDSQTIYVWLDALINYLTKSGFPWTPGHESAGGWPADVHVVGKDIVRFHCIYWPAFLMALDIEPPRQVLPHAHWTLGHRKMAKSTGNVVNPFFAIDRFGTETMRFYLAHDGGLEKDANYDNEHIITRYKKCLQGGLGNLASRITRGKGWSVRAAVQAAFDSSTAQETNVNGSSSAAQRQLLHRLPQVTEEQMDRPDVSAALKTIMDAIFQTNAYLQDRSPWTNIVNGSVKEEKKKSIGHVNETVYLCAEALRISGILLQPCIPEKAAQLLNTLGVGTDRRSLAWAKLGADEAYGQSTLQLGRGHEGVLFPPLRSDE